MYDRRACRKWEGKDAIFVINSANSLHSVTLYKIQVNLTGGTLKCAILTPPQRFSSTSVILVNILYIAENLHLDIRDLISLDDV